MIRFIAVLGKGLSHSTQHIAECLNRSPRSTHAGSWRSVLQSQNAAVLQADPASKAIECYSLGDSRGIILGKLFRAGTASAATLTREDADRIVATRGRELVGKYWGQYLAIVSDGEDGYCVLRDPTGAVAGYFLQLGGLTLVFSHLADCRALIRGPLTVDWHHVVACLHFSRIVSTHTGFVGLKRIQAGECISTASSPAAATFYWRPADLYRTQALEDPRQAVDMLRQAVFTSVQAWSSCYDRILLELSGGLDSSIVLMCLADTRMPAQLTCLNLHTPTPEGDERVFARIAARHARCELVESLFGSLKKSLQQMICARELPSPAMVTLKSVSEDTLANLARTRRAEAIFSGRGGDQLFQRRRDAHIAAEYVHRHGLRPGLLRVALATAKITETSLWAVLATALRSGLLGRRADPYDILRAPTFLGGEAAALLDRDGLRHPWVVEAAALPSSKAQQIFDIVDTQNYFTCECRYADAVPALVSQPVIESVLRIPTYILTRGGRERALVREAFAAKLPAQIVERKVKGEVTGFYQNLINANLGYVRELMLGGMLVERKILNKALLEAALSAQGLARGAELIAVLTAIKAESWARAAAVQCNGFLQADM